MKIWSKLSAFMRLANLSIRGNLLYKKEDYPQALPFYINAHDLALEAFGEKHLTYASTLNNLAMLYEATGDYARAEPLFRQALEITRVGGEKSRRYAKRLNNLALLYHRMGDYARAEPLYRQALEIRYLVLGEQHPDYAVSLNNLALLYRDMSDYAQAKRLYRQAEGIDRQRLGERHPDYAITLNNLAGLYCDMGDYVQAEPLYRQARDIFRRVRGEKSRDYVRSLDNLATLYQDLGDYSRAEPLYRQALEIRRQVLGEQHRYYAMSLSNLAKLLATLGRLTESISLMEQAQAILDSLVQQVFAFVSERQRGQFLVGLWADVDVFLSAVLKSTPSASGVRAALNLILRRKGLEFSAASAQQEAVFEGRYPHLKPRLRQLYLLRRQIAQRTWAGPGIEDASSHQARLQEWQNARERLEAELAAEIREMRLEQEFATADLDAVARCLPKDAVLVEFKQFRPFDFGASPVRGESRSEPERYLAFVLPAGRPDRAHMVDLGEVASIYVPSSRWRGLTRSKPMARCPLRPKMACSRPKTHAP